jgi:RhtB (resistance to homoserine/threonine) family protein
MYVAEFIALAAAQFLVMIAPGPDFAITISQTIRNGRRAGILTALGISAGVVVHVLYTLLGVGTLMRTTPEILHWAKALGAAYLLYLGWCLIRSQPQTNSGNDSAKPKQSGHGAFVTGFLTNALNPKVTLFFLAIFTTLVSASTPIEVQIFYGVWMCFISAVWFALVSVLFSQQKVLQAFLPIGHWFERVMGVVFIGFAIRLFWQW